MGNLKKLLKKQGFTLEILNSKFGILNGKGKGFTLVELIIVIAIIAVLAVAAFMMLTKWLGHSRDARKIGDVATIKKALNIAFVEKPIYPEPTNKAPIKDADGNVLWYQGVFGLTSANGIDTLQKAPVNPTDDSYYTYSVTTDQKEYQIGVWLENGDEVSFINSVFAVEGFARIEGEYDGYVTYSSGTDGKIIKIPSLILTDGDTIDLSGSNTNLMIEGKSEGEPFEVKNVAFNPENVDNDKLINDIKSTFGMEDDKAAMLVIEDNSSITPSAIIYAGCDSDTRTINGRVYNVPAMSHGGSKAVNVEDGSFTNGTKYWTVTFSCNAETLSEGTETEVIDCTDGFIESNGACELDKCDGDMPDNAESNATSTGIGTTRNYTTTPGKCTYECKEGFHTEDGGITCVDDMKNLACGGSFPENAIAKNGTGYVQTWDGSSWSSTYDWTYDASTCGFECDSLYVWNGTSCYHSIWGDGSDGNKIVSSNNTVINTYAYLTTTKSLGSTTLSVDSTSGFIAGDEVLIIQMQDGGTDCVAGSYEYKRIASVTSNTITFATGTTNKYCLNTPMFGLPSSSYKPTSGVDTSAVAQVVRVPNYANLTINAGASLTSPYWNGRTGGIVVFRATGTANLNGGIYSKGKGFRGGSVFGVGDDDDGGQGEGTSGWGRQGLTTTCDGRYVRNGIGGGGSACINDDGGDAGAGGGHATAGGNVPTNSGCSIPQGGSTIGSADLSKIYFGGGGGGGSDSDDLSCIYNPFATDSNGGATMPNLCQLGGHGGGIVLGFAETITNAKIDASGHTTSPVWDGGPGGGAGGTIWLKANSLDIISLKADGGPVVCDNKESPAADCGGAGGQGRIRLDYNSKTGTNISPAVGYTGNL